MCNPMLIAGALLTAGSVVSNNIAAGKAEKARNGALQAERTRQSGFRDEAMALNESSQDQYANFGDKQAAKAEQLSDYYQSQQAATPLANAAVPTSASNVTVQEDAKQRGLAKLYTDKTGAALGQLRAFGDEMGGAGRAQARDAGQIGQIGGFMRGSQGVLPYELENASHAGDGLRTLGSLMGAGGSALTMGGLSGVGAAGAAASAGSASAPAAFLSAPATSLGTGAATSSFLSAPAVSLAGAGASGGANSLASLYGAIPSLWQRGAPRMSAPY